MIATPDFANCCWGSLLLSFSKTAEDIEQNPRNRGRIVAACLVFGFGGFFITDRRKRQADTQMVGTVREPGTYNPPVNRTELARQFNYFAVQMTTFRTVHNQRVTSGA